MDPLHHIELVCKVLATSIEMQFSALSAYKNSEAYKELLSSTTQVVETTLRILDTIESDFIKDVEDTVEAVGLRSAELVKEVAKISEREPDVLQFRQLTRALWEKQQMLTKTLGEKEDSIEAEITARLAVQKNRFRALITQAENA